MPHLILGLVIIVLSACAQGPDAKKLALNTTESTINLAKQVPGEWERVCILGPYSLNHHVEEVTGLNIDIQVRSRISTLDSLSLLVPIKDDVALELYEIERSNVDFSSVAGRCYPRQSSGFNVNKGGHPFVQPAAL